MFASSCLGKEGCEGVIADHLVRGHVTVGLDPVLQTVQLPTGVANLAAGLADVDGNAFTLRRKKMFFKIIQIPVEQRKSMQKFEVLRIICGGFEHS